MTKKKLTLWQRFVAETPIFVRILQAIVGAVSAAPLYYNSLPADFQVTIPKSFIGIVSIVGFVSVLLLNLIVPKNYEPK